MYGFKKGIQVLWKTRKSVQVIIHLRVIASLCNQSITGQPYYIYMLPGHYNHIIIACDDPICRIVVNNVGFQKGFFGTPGIQFIWLFMWYGWMKSPLQSISVEAYYISFLPGHLNHLLIACNDPIWRIAILMNYVWCQKRCFVRPEVSWSYHSSTCDCSLHRSFTSDGILLCNKYLV
jgi:hypothetical protein